MHNRINWIKHKGKEILFLDYSSLNAQEMIEFLHEIEKFYESDIIKSGKKDILVLSDVANARVFGEALTETKRVIKSLRPLSKKSAMVGLSNAKIILLAAINLFAGESKASKNFSSIEAAKDYLAE